MSAATIWLLRSPRHPEAASLRVVPLTTLTGLEDNPTFSPDGEQVAFSWNGARQDNEDIYVTLVGSSDARRLTSDPSADTHSTWSPDGRQIASCVSDPAVPPSSSNQRSAVQTAS
jgi:Tol biopolymer transport system component